MAENNNLMTSEEVAKYLGVSTWQISRYCNAEHVGAGNVIPHRRIGKKYYYCREQVDKWILERRD